MAVAARLFRSGVQAARAGRWDEARQAFARSYETAAVPVTLFNLAGAQAELGQLVEAAESYRRFLPDSLRGRARRHREEAQAALARLEARIPRARVDVQGEQPGDRVLLDGEVIAELTLVPLDPGTHRFQVIREGRPVADRTIELPEGQTRSVRLDVVSPLALRETDASPDRDADDERGPPLWQSPWLWSGVGAVVLVGVGVALGVTLGTTEPEPFEGNAGSMVYELRGRR